MRLAICALLTLSLLGMSGCAVHFYGSAQAPNGGTYVAGMKAGRAAMFLCPSQPKQGECKLVEVQD